MSRESFAAEIALDVRMMFEAVGLVVEKSRVEGAARAFAGTIYDMVSDQIQDHAENAPHLYPDGSS